MIAYLSIFTNASKYFYWGVSSGYGAVVTVTAYAFISGGGRRTSTGVMTALIIVTSALGFAQLEGWSSVTWDVNHDEEKIKSSMPGALNFDDILQHD